MGPVEGEMRAALVLMVLAGCDGGGGGAGGGNGCDATSPGSLAISLPDLGLDAPATAVVLDPTGAEVGRYTESATLPDLPPGAYVVVTERGLRSDPGARTDRAFGAPSATMQRVCVGGATATVDLDVEEQPSSGHLWVAAGEQLVGVRAADLDPASSSATPDAARSVGLTNNFSAVRFDRSGDLWVATAPTYGVRLMMFRPDQLAGDGEMEPALTISAPELTDDYAAIADLWFSDDGDLWALEAGSGTNASGFLGWSRADLVDAVIDGGEIALPPTWNHPIPGLLSASDVVQAGGALYVTVVDRDAIDRFDPADLSAPVGSVTVESDGTPLRGPTDLTVVGDVLWADFWTDGTIAGVPVGADGAVEGDLATIDWPFLPVGYGLDADLGGGLWWANSEGAGVVLRARGPAGDDLGQISLGVDAYPDEIRFDPSPGG
jgi:hypothetical protein